MDWFLDFKLRKAVHRAYLLLWISFLGCFPVLEAGTNVIMYSAMDDAYIPKYINYTSSKMDYCQKHNYRYLYKPSDFGFKEGEVQPNFYRIHAALRLLKGEVPSVDPNTVDYIIYMDADAFVVEKGIPFEALIAAAKHYVKADSMPDKDECYFITQDYPHGINSGFWILKNTPWSIAILQAWLDDCQKEKKYNFNWVFDQGPLQNVMLFHAASLRNATYQDECWIKHKWDHGANICWTEQMSLWQFPFQKRKIGHICLLPINMGVPLKHHLHGNHRPGEMVRHQKGLSGEKIASVKSFFQDYIMNESVEANYVQYYQFKPKTLLKWYKTMYLVGEDGKKHRFPGFNTFAAMGFDFENAVEPSLEIFNSLPLGDELPKIA